jgi:hypothetical protein
MAEIELVEDVDLGDGWEGEIKRATYRGGNETYLAILYAGYGGTAPGESPGAPPERGYRVLEGEYFTTREARDGLRSMLARAQAQGWRIERQGDRTVITGPRHRVTYEGGQVREERM